MAEVYFKLLLEDGDHILKEDGDKLLLESYYFETAISFPFNLTIVKPKLGLKMTTVKTNLSGKNNKLNLKI